MSQPSDADQPILDPFTLKRFEFTIEHHVPPWPDPGDVLIPSMADIAITTEATVKLDRADYDRLIAAAPLYTIEMTTDHNPWRRKATGARARLRKLRDCLSWSFRRRVLRRKLIGADDDHRAELPSHQRVAALR